MSEFSWDARTKAAWPLTFRVLVLAAALLVTGFLFLSVLPRMIDSFVHLNITIPWYTSALMQVSTQLQGLLVQLSSWLQKFWPLALGALAGGTWWSCTPKGRYQIARALLAAPAIGPVVNNLAMSRVAKTLAKELAGAGPAERALSLTQSLVGNAVLEEAIGAARSSVQGGDGLAAALEKTGRFPAKLIQILRAGERTGNIEEMLRSLTGAFEEEVQKEITASTRLMDTVILVFMTMALSLMALSVLGPMIQAMNVSR